MNKPEIAYLVISDIHLGNKRNRTSDIIDNLGVFFDNYKPRSDLDIIFIAGDVFDRLLDFSTDDMSETMIWALQLLNYCHVNKIKLRILEGTPSHDWMQSNIFETVLKICKYDVDFKYMTTLCIEFIEDLGINVLYLPDEWNISTDVTFEQIQSLLSENNLNHVDVAIMHGSFGYQLPNAAMKAPRHNEEAYLGIVKYFINIGHVHKFSNRGRILAQGSFDRLSYGEEEPKGGTLCRIRNDGSCEYSFIENVGAKKFITIQLKGNDIDSGIRQIEKKTANLPIDAYVRIKAKKDHPLLLALDEIKKRFPYFVISKITLEEEAETLTNSLIDEIDHKNTYEAITICPDNIEMLLFAEIKIRHDLTENQLAMCRKVLNEAIN